MIMENYLIKEPYFMIAVSFHYSTTNDVLYYNIFILQNNSTLYEYFCILMPISPSCFYMQKQPFTDVLKIRCSEKVRKIHRKTPVLESLFNKNIG